MTFDAGAKTVVIKGKWQGPDGEPAQGYIELYLDAPISDKDLNVDVNYTQIKKKYPLDATGSVSIPFIVTDTVINPSLSKPVSLNIREVFAGAKPNKWSTVVTDVGDGNFYLSAASPVEVRPMNQYVLLGTFNTALDAKGDRVKSSDTQLTTVTANTLVRRDGTGKVKFAAPTVDADGATKGYVDALGAVSADASSIMRRDANGRAQVGTPVAAADIATKSYVDALGTITSTASTIMRRDASGRSQVADPSAVNDITSKQYVDAQDYFEPTTQTASYTLVAGNAFNSVEMNSASATTVTIPPNSSVAFPIGTIIHVVRLGAGTVTLVAGSGVTIRTPSVLTIGPAQYGSVELKKRATNEWIVSGHLG